MLRICFADLADFIKQDTGRTIRDPEDFFSVNYDIGNAYQEMVKRKILKIHNELGKPYNLMTEQFPLVKWVDNNGVSRTLLALQWLGNIKHPRYDTVRKINRVLCKAILEEALNSYTTELYIKHASLVLDYINGEDKSKESFEKLEDVIIHNYEGYYEELESKGLHCPRESDVLLFCLQNKPWAAFDFYTGDVVVEHQVIMIYKLQALLIHHLS